MPCPASADAAETANGAVERMVLLGLTGAYYTKFRGSFSFSRKRRKDRKVPRSPEAVKDKVQLAPCVQ